MNDLSIDTLKDQVHEALSLWHKGSGAGSPLADLLIFRSAKAEGGSVRRVTNQIVLDAIARLEGSDAQAAAVLRLRFADDQPAQIVANRLNVSEGHVFKKQRESIQLLAELLLDQELDARSTLQDRLGHRLELPTYSRLFGVDAALDGLVHTLTQPGPPWFVAVEGIGGIGKTSLAHALASRLIVEGEVGWRTFADLGWVAARRQIFNAGGALPSVDRPSLSPDQLIYGLAGQLLPDMGASRLSLEQTGAALARRLRTDPHLIIIDNLETRADLVCVMEVVRAWAGPTKFLFTSRRTLIGEDALFHFRLPGLCEADALALLRHESALRNLPAIAQADDGELRPIFRHVGGNPLALRLVVGQTLVHSLPHVLEDLASAQGQAAENLYTYIYRRAWENLSEPERETLLLMPLVHENGSDLAYLARIAQRSLTDLRPLLQRLVGLNLVDSVGGLSERRYTIHNLTRTFLQEQVLRWAG